jgi:hypothetical protein
MMFPHVQTLRWGSNPISEYSLYLFLKHCNELKNLSIGGTIIKLSIDAPEDYKLVFQRGISRLRILELLDYEDSSFEEGSTFEMLPTTLDDILKTIPNNGTLPKHPMSHSTPDLSQSSRSLVDATTKTSGFGRITGFMNGLTKKPSANNIEFESLENIPALPKKITTRRTELPLLLRKHLTGSLMSLTLTCKTATDLLANISRRTSGLARCDLSNSSELDDRAV